MKTRITSLLFLAVAFVLASCSSTERRINKDLAYFDSLPVAQQDLIKQGKVAIGFTPEMVRLAVGNPDKTWVRTDGSGTSESWSYTRYTTDTGLSLYCGLYHSYYGDLYPYYTDPIYTGRAPSEYFRVVFKDGKVSAIQEDAL